MRLGSFLLVLAPTVLVATLTLTACPGGDAPYSLDDGSVTGDGSSSGTSSGTSGTSGTSGDGSSSGDDGSSSGDSAAPDAGPTGTGARCGVNGRDDCGAFKVCDPLLGCVDCALDTDCPLSSPHCVAGACVACRSALVFTAVDAGPDADAGDAGTIGTAPADCPTKTPSCWPQDHTCHAACTDATSCPTGAKTCNTASGQCWGCTLGTDCASGVCATGTQQCVECVDDTSCSGAKPRCDQGHGICVQCTYNQDCGLAAPICDPATRACRQGCTSDVQCPGQSCDLPSATCVPLDAGVDSGVDAADAALE